MVNKLSLTHLASIHPPHPPRVLSWELFLFWHLFKPSFSSWFLHTPHRFPSLRKSISWRCPFHYFLFFQLGWNHFSAHRSLSWQQILGWEGEVRTGNLLQESAPWGQHELLALALHTQRWCEDTIWDPTSELCLQDQHWQRFWPCGAGRSWCRDALVSAGFKL